MDIRKCYPTKYLSPVDLTDKDGNYVDANATVRSFSMVNVRLQDGASKPKPILHFEGKQKGMIINKTNARTLERLLGWDTDKWVGKKIGLVVEKIKAFGEMMDVIKVTEPIATGAKPATVLKEGKEGEEDVHPSEIPESVGKKKK